MATQENKGPVHTIRDGAVSAKIWRNEVESQPMPFYSVTFQRTYTDEATQKVRETHSFSNTDILKVQQLAPQAYHAVSQFRTQDRAELQQDQAPRSYPEQGQGQGQPGQQNGLSQQRDAAMNAAPQSNGQSPQHQREPEI